MDELGARSANPRCCIGFGGKTYQEMFLSQKNRPKGMEYFDFVVSEIHGLRIRELLDAKAEGRKVIGTFCVFVPEEIVLALNAVCVGLCAGAELGFEAAEEYIPRNTCSLIKSAFGFKLAKVCPYIEATDLIVGENTCDGKKKAFESYGDLVGNLYVMDLPQTKSEAGKALLKAEYLKFAAKLEELTGVELTVENLKKGIETVNNKRKAMHRLANCVLPTRCLFQGSMYCWLTRFISTTIPSVLQHRSMPFAMSWNNELQTARAYSRKMHRVFYLADAPWLFPTGRCPALLKTREPLW